MNNDKPTLLLLVGVEGSGHHMIRALLTHFLNTQKAMKNGDWYFYLFNRWDALKKEQRTTPLTLNSQSELKTEISRIINNYSSSVDYFYSSPSFPYGHERDTLRRPDIIDMVEVLSDYVEIRPLVIHRDPISCTYSAVRRDFTGNLLHQARFVEDNLIFIKQQIEAAELNYQTLSYEHFVSNAREYETGFKQWWGVSSASFQEGIKHIRPATSKNEIPTESLQKLEEFFSPMRRKQWDSFLQKNRILELN